jgi:HSP20 family molecular chaperone IbpA
MSSKDLTNLNGSTRELSSQRNGENLPTPYGDWGHMMGQWDSWFDQMWNRMMSLSTYARTGGQPWGNVAGGYVPAVNVNETDNAFQVTAELPGLEPNDIELSFNRGSLTISGEKRQEHEEKQQGYHRVERSYGRFSRSVQLPEGVDGDKIEAGFKNGVLTVTVPKLPEAQRGAKRIQIRGEGK